MASLDDQFQMGRIPIKPLPYSSRTNAQCNEFMINYGEGKDYHMYIVHHSDKTKYIDLTNLIINEALPNAAINANNFTVSIEGIDEPESLQDILNFIYKRFLYPDNQNGFDVTVDLDKLYDDATVNILMRDTSGTIYLPVTTAENVYDSTGKSIEERLNDMTHMAFSIDYIYAETEHQTSFKFQYPFENYSDFMEVRIGTTYVDRTRYTIIEETADDGNIYGGTINFIDEGVEAGRRIDLLFVFNALTVSSGSYNYISGTQIANGTINTSKMAKVTDSYTLNDSDTLATAAAVYNLYQVVADIGNEDSDLAMYVFDTSTSTTYFTIESPIDLNQHDAYVINMVTNDTVKKSSATIRITYNGVTSNYPIYTIDGEEPTVGYPANKLIKLLWRRELSCFYLVDNGAINISESKMLHTCFDAEYTISYNGLQYSDASLIHVWRNGNRLFSDIDYSIDTAAEEITLYVRTEFGDNIVFEAINAE